MRCRRCRRKRPHHRYNSRPPMRPSSRKTLEALAAELGAARFRALIDDIRAAKPDELLTAPANPKRVKQTGDPLIVEVTALLAPILGRSSEKADLLVDHLQKLTGKS